MKIGITCYPTYGGSGVVATELGLELARRGHEIHFISYSQPIRLTGPEPNIHYHEVEVTRYPLFEYPPYDLALATRMAEVSQLYELDLLHVHYAIPHSVSAMLAKQMLAATPPRRNLPFVTTLHGTDITLVGLDRAYLPITRFSIEQSDGVTAISQYLRTRTLKVFDIKNHIEVIPNFVNCDDYERKPEWMEKRSEYVSNDERLLVHLSNFRPVKRVLDVIEIFDRVRKKIPSKLLLIGDGPDRSQAEWLAVQKGIHEHVLFLGKQDQIREKLAISDVMLMPSELETFGLAALRSGADCHAHGRSAGSDRARRQRISGRRRRRGHHGALRHRSAERRIRSARHGKTRPRRRPVEILLQQDYSALRRFLPKGVGAVSAVGAAVISSSGLGRIGRRNRMSVPPPSRFSMIIRAASP
jgi:N-acetyl-alpha-D-glucosaminyl L-malate synthase BshA